ncbi:serine/threonine-protein kinase [Gemmatimonas sp.]|uniref:serine/threonine-protein kinase n=1 Tax=Gemmatimonas sp. TaxID=1962908 RepID=UPI00286EB211|nr:serine/threonine-protein kinase [Gemmatimonas sp.]
MASHSSRELAELSPLLDQALTLTGDARSAWLATLRNEQPEAAARLEALLAAEAGMDADRFLADSPSHELTPDAVAPDAVAPDALVGRRLGAYTLERPLGQGGMGSVWLARRSDGRYDGVAALKLPHLSRLSNDGIRRFQREGSALAKLTHPNIARLTDAGVADDGQPYLVLEYVDGTRIDRWCDERKLDPDARLALFQQVLAAVAHAHASLLVHRDLKPSNILVTADGAVKLLDFGIVKLLEAAPDGSDPVEITGVGGGPLTPEYAAPEQVSGGPITTATDIYALGVLLYQLLSGRHPTAGDSRSAVDMLQAVAATMPRRMSAVVADEKLRKLYAGDLDVIVAKTLEKDPSQRYASVAALSDDIARFQRHAPVKARPSSTWYRTQKFVRRNRLGVTVGAGVVAALLTATVITAQQSIVARTERDESRKQRDLALLEERRATAANGFLQTLVQAVPTGEPFTPATLMTRARTLLEGDYAADPRFASRMLLDLASSFEAIDDAASERALLERARELAVRSGDLESESRAQCSLALLVSRDPDSTAVSRPFVDAGDAAIAKMRPATAAAQVPCLMARARIVGELGPADSALTYGERALAVAEASGDTSSATFTSLLSELTDTYHNNNRVRDAYNVALRWANTLERTGRGSSILMLRARQRAATDLRDLGEMQSADSALRDVIALARRIDSTAVPPYVSVLAGEIAKALDRPDSAVAVLERAVLDARRSKDNFRTSWALSQLVITLADAGRVAPATIRREEFAKANSLGAGTLTMLDARIADARGQPDRSLPAYMAALAERGFPNGRGAPPYHRVVYRAARAALATGNARAADSLAAHAVRLEGIMGHKPTQSGDMGLSMLVRARAQLLLGDSTSARSTLASAQTALRYGLGVGHAATRDAQTLAGALEAALAAR